MTAVTQILKSSVTGQFELGRVLWAVATLALIGYQGFAIWWTKQPFSPIEFGTGAAAILAAGGFGIAAKDIGVARATTAAVSDAA
jgi:hypothetical protein